MGTISKVFTVGTISKVFTVGTISKVFTLAQTFSYANVYKDIAYGMRDCKKMLYLEVRACLQSKKDISLNTEILKLLKVLVFGTVVATKILF